MHSDSKKRRSFVALFVLPVMRNAMAINPQDWLQTATSIATGAELISETPVQLGRETLVQ